MKRLMLVWVVILVLGLSVSLAEEESNRLNIAFGLFSVELPEGVTAGPNTGTGFLSDFRYEMDGMLQLIYANYAKIDEYESTAQGNLNNLLSMVYVLSGSDPSHYSETEITEETLENGIRLRWQLMRGSALHALWFEAFDEHYGYNMCIECSTKTADDDALLAVMRSFSVNPDIERDLFNIGPLSRFSAK